MPTLEGALGAMAGETEPRHYALLDACTFKPGRSPNWEGFGNPFASIVKFARGTHTEGLLIVSLLPEFWGNPTQRHLLIGK